MCRCPLVKATSRDSLPNPRPELVATNWPTTDEPPPASCANVTSLTMAFSSSTVPHWMQTASPRAASVSMTVEPQFGQQGGMPQGGWQGGRGWQVRLQQATEGAAELDLSSCGYHAMSERSRTALHGALMERLGECKNLQKLKLMGTSRLTALPDLSSLPNLKALYVQGASKAAKLQHKAWARSKD